MDQDLNLSAVRVSDEQLALADARRVTELCAALQAGQPIPPISVFPVRKGFRLLAGVEQVLACQRAGQLCIRADVQPRSNEDKRRAAAAVLLDPLTRHMSDRAIGRLCAVDDHVVARARRDLYMQPRREVLVQRGRQLFMRRLPTRRETEAIPLTLHDTPYAKTAIPDAYADVILTVPPVGAFVPIEAHAQRMARHLQADGTAYLWFDADNLSWLFVWQRALARCALPFRQTICWAVSMDPDPAIYPRYEVILVVARHARFLGGSDLLRGRRPASVREPAQVYRKPLGLVEQILTRHDPNVLLDPFVRSGVTLRAAQRAGLAEATGCLLDASFAAEVQATLGRAT